MGKVEPQVLKGEMTVNTVKAYYALIKTGDKIYCAWCKKNVTYWQQQNINFHLEEHEKKDAIQKLKELSAFFQIRYKDNPRMNRDIMIALNDLVELIEPVND